MLEVKAFVGHSFASEDEAVVGSFLGLFASFAEANQNFSCDHALKAQPIDLVAKVLQKIEGKNVFIGICTQKEEVITATNSRRFLGFRLLLDSQTAWKTSDWVIQEIGLAVGKGLKLILFVEQGVRLPGGLQGNIEYIEFSRNDIGRSFVKFLQMFSQLSPSLLPGMSTTGSSDKPDHMPAPKEETDENFWTPNADWELDDYRMKLFFAILRKNHEKELNIDNAYRANAARSDPVSLVNWTAFHELMKIIHGSEGNFQLLADLAKSNPNNHYVIASLARAQANFDNFAEAAALYETAASLATDGLDQLKYIKNATINHQKIHNDAETHRLIEKIRNKYYEDSQLEYQCLKELKDIYEGDGLHSLELIILERLAHLNPADSDGRFSVAFQHSRHGSQELSLYHYLLIQMNERSAMAWNNLGVQYEQLKLYVKAVRAFRRSDEMGETLAMSNLANRYIKGGFLDQAAAICEKARSISGYHSNVDQSMTRLEQIQSAEDEKENALRTKLREQSYALQQFGQAVLKPLMLPISGVWNHPQFGELIIEVNGTELQATGSFERQVNALAVALGARQQTYRDLVFYRGTLHGCAVVGQRTISSSEPKSILGDLDNTSDILMYLSESGNEWHVLKDPFSQKTQAYTLIRAGTLRMGEIASA